MSAKVSKLRFLDLAGVRYGGGRCACDDCLVLRIVKRSVNEIL